MRRLFLSLAAASMLAGPALAQQDHAAHHPAAAEAQAQATPTHEMCQSVMGRQMAGKPVHDHGRDKTGAATWPNGKPLTAAEMEAMHKKCAEKMQKADAAAKAK
jgi:hypothetical protein